MITNLQLHMQNGFPHTILDNAPYKLSLEYNFTAYLKSLI